ncbi:LacI family DNA-binding transcriptional regulator [Coraliomargarita algicola]|uniref:LacI family DNA-binding transcriptional regulator n=1 Tax=Coraliomargarita algicola TaxID=3092156 RepID=A0ABZ0RNP6_9BACT|nr:LacI family DNA-binding transcriptional regulator [Coraliomargarita sp. J2-16]WPJ96756.1 LacI family DNA-binding transcriptional regulator [Coraliomargarita sp. J2-16]
MSISQTKLAQQLGVSRSAVSHVLNGREHMVGEETRERILAAIRESGYHKNALVRALKANRTDIIGIIVPETSMSFFNSIIRGVEMEAQLNGLRCLLCQSYHEICTLEQHISALREYRVDGLVIGPSSSNIDDRIFRTLQEHRVPFVLFDNPLENLKTAFVGTENVVAGRMAAEHLLELGHRKIACIKGYMDSEPARGRLQGYLEAMDAAGIEVRPEWVLDGGFSFEDGVAAIDQLRSNQVDFSAVVAASDHVAFGAINALVRHGLRVPQDVSVVGCGNLDLAGMFMPSLTTVDQDPLDVGRQALRLLVGQIKKKKLSSKAITIQPKLVCRDSTAPL